jgi:hypothetical protein
MTENHLKKESSMPDITVKFFNQKMEMLKKLLDGIKLHKNDEGFPSIISEETVQKMIDSFAALRATFEHLMSQAHQVRAQITTEDKKIDKDAGKFKTMLYGFYGKKSLIVRDFGMKPFKDARPRAKKAAP